MSEQLSDHLRYEATEVVTRTDHGITYHASACLDCGALVWDTRRHDQFHDGGAKKERTMSGEDVRRIAAAKLWRMRDLFYCQPCASEPCGEDCQCPHHDDVGALSEAIKALAGSAEGGQVFRQDIDGIRLEWVRLR